MSLLQFLLIQLNLTLLFALYLFLQRKGQLQFNRIFLLVGPLISIVLPFLSFEKSSNDTFSVLLPVIEIANKTQTANASVIAWSQLFIAGICGVMVLLFVLSLIKILRPKHVVFLENYKGYRVYLLENTSATTHSFFKRIYLHPKHLDFKEIVLEHEFAHCASKHSIDLIVMTLYKSLFWFHPLVYKWLREMQLNHEYLADAHVLRQGVPAQTYGTTLLALNFSCAPNTLVHAFNQPSTLRKRIVQFNHKNKYKMKHLIIVPALVGMAALSMSLTAPMQTAPTEVATQKITGDPEVKPEFPGGQDALMQYVATSIVYPKSLVKENATGKVFVQFTVAKTGEVTNVKTLQSSGFEEMDAEAIRVIQNMPNWTPATKNGKAVAAEMTLPFQFALSND